MSNFKRRAIVLLALLVQAVSVPAFATSIIPKDADTLRLEQELAAAAQSGKLMFDVASTFLEDRSVSKACRQAALKVLEEWEGEKVEVYLRQAIEETSLVDPELTIGIKVTLARRGLRRCSTSAEEIQFLGQQLRDGLEAGEYRHVVQFYAEELCDRGASLFLTEIERALGGYIAPRETRNSTTENRSRDRRTRTFVSPRLRDRLVLCHKQIALVEGHEKALNAFREALVTEDLTPGMRLHGWAIRSLLLLEDPVAQEILLEYALRWQEVDQTRSGYVIARLKAKGWTEERLIERGWHPTPSSIHALRPKQAPEAP